MKELLRTTLAVLFFFGFSSGNIIIPAYSAAQTKTVDCQNSKSVVGACFWIRGLIYIGSGNPAVRIKGSKPSRSVGIKEDENPILPENLSSILTTENPVGGKFLFCPFSVKKTGHLQVGCVEKAERLKAKN